MPSAHHRRHSDHSDYAFDDSDFDGSPYGAEPTDRPTYTQGRSRRTTATTPELVNPTPSPENLHEYDIIAPDECAGPSKQDPTRDPVEPYHFPGTWARARADTAVALKQVGVASKAFGGALVQSGMGKATWSIGRAFAASANRGAALAASAALDAASTDQTELPRPLRRWLGTDRREAARRKRREEQHATDAQMYPPSDAVGGEVGDVHLDGSLVARANAASRSNADYCASRGAGQSLNMTRADTNFAQRRTSSSRRQSALATEEWPYENSSGGAYFDNGAESAGWMSRRQSLAGNGASRPAPDRNLASFESRADGAVWDSVREEEEEAEPQEGGNDDDEIGLLGDLFPET